MLDDFCCFIISHGRSDRVLTYSTLRRCGYTGPIRIVVDNLDTTAGQYTDKYGDEVVIFNKEEIAKTTDQGNNFNNLRTTTHARNACFEIAEKLGFKYFLVLDDDYNSFLYKFDSNFSYSEKLCKSLDAIFGATLSFYSSNKRILSIAFSQQGDFVGGIEGSPYAKRPRLIRKCMNSFFCCTERKYKFVSQLNEDVNTYITLGGRGNLFLTTTNISIKQLATQSNSGGMTDAYIDSGTYVKSFYSVMYQPSSVKVRPLGGTCKRLHHAINWRSTVPCILSEAHRKASAPS